jgi:hypothetical protein
VLQRSLGTASGRRVGDAGDAHVRAIDVSERSDGRPGRDHVGALLQRIVGPEIDDLCARLVLRHEGDIPLAPRPRLGDLSGARVANDLERHSSLAAQRVSQIDGHAARLSGTGVARRPEGGRRSANAHGDPQLSCRRELLHRRGLGSHTDCTGQE